MICSAIIGAVLACIVSAQAQSVTWITPPNAGASVDYTNNPVVSIGSVYDLQWTSSLDTYSIWLWQQDTGRGYTYPGNSIYSVSVRNPKWTQANLRSSQKSHR